MSSIFWCFSQDKVYNFLYFTTKDGLAGNVIRSLAEDKRGVIWLTTNKGLSYFDGSHFHNLFFESKENYYSNDLGAISIADNNKIWLTTYNQGLFCYDPSLPIQKSIKRYLPAVSNNLVKSELYTVHAAKSGLIYFGGQETDLQVLNPKDSSIRVISIRKKIGHATIFTIVEDDKGVLWLGTRYDGIVSYNPKTSQIVNYDLENQGENGVSAISLVGNNIFGAYYDKDLVRINSLTLKMDTKGLLNMGTNIKPYDNFITTLKYSKKDKSLLIGHVSKGIFRYDLAKKTSHHITWDDISPQKKIEARINEILLTQNGYFLATTNGLFFYANKLNKIQNYIPNIAESPIVKIIGVNDAKYYLTSKEIGLLSSDCKNRLRSTNLNGLHISSAKPIGHFIYLSTFDSGVYLYNTQTNSISKLEIEGESYGFEKADCNTVLEDNFNGENILWIGSWNSGVYKYNRESKKIKLYNKGNGLVDNKVINVGKDRNGTIWLGTDGFGLIQYDKKLDKFYNYSDGNSPGGISSNTIFSFLLDRNNRFWYTGSNSGIGKINYELGRYKFFHVEDKNNYPWVYGKKLVEDQNGQIWMMTPEGAVIFNPINSSFLQLEPGRGIFPVEEYKVFDYFHDNNSIYWLTNRGIISGQISDIKLDSLDLIKPIISSFKIFNQDNSYRLFSKNIVLNSNENSFSISFASNEFVKNKRLKFAYKLEGVDENWVEADDNLQANYTNLVGGNYIFKLKIGDVDGNWSKNEISLPIRVKINWINSIYLKIALIGLFFTGLVLFLIYRIKQQRKINLLQRDFNLTLKEELQLNEIKIKEQSEVLEAERQEKIESAYRQKLYESELKAIRSQMNPHFIFNVLNSIEAYVVEKDSMSASKLIHKFAALSRIVLENSHSSLVTLSSEVDLLKLYLDLEQERFAFQFSYEIILDEDKDVLIKKIPSMLLQPIVENAVHHGVRHLVDKKGKILILIKKTNNTILVEVTDNGVGFENNKNNKVYTGGSFGIKGIKERINMINLNTLYPLASMNIIHLPKEDEFTTKVVIVLPLQ